jgi:hypothetical protein
VTKKQSKPKKPITEKQRKSDDELRERLKSFDIKVLDRFLEKAVKPQKRQSG